MLKKKPAKQIVKDNVCTGAHLQTLKNSYSLIFQASTAPMSKVKAKVSISELNFSEFSVVGKISFSVSALILGNF